MQKLIFLIALMSTTVAQANSLKIYGTVYDETGSPIPGVNILELNTTNSTASDQNGKYELLVTDEKSKVSFSFVGYVSTKEAVGKRRKIDVILELSKVALQEVVVTGYGVQKKTSLTGSVSRSSHLSQTPYVTKYDFNTEGYDAIEENIFHTSLDKPLSTFSIDVDAASYSNVRRFLNMGQMPPKDAVRIEEMINYFNYNYEGPIDGHPFAIHTGKTKAPWNNEHFLVKIGVKGQKLEMDELPPSNIVFLLDVSGSMNAPNKLPLLKSSLKMLVNELRPNDKVSIVVYAGASGLVLPATNGSNKTMILKALNNLQAGGSTAGGEGIALAYKIAEENLVAGGNNRVILATDGDFNVGVSSDAQMQRLIEGKRENGVSLTVLGFGMGNYKDSKMEILADKGNGNYAYIDNIMEAKKVLVTEFGGTLFTIAKDVKIQVEFNPNQVQAYRLIGYENRKLNNEDFNNDQKDAGELGNGHTVTALYEIIPVGVNSKFIQHIDTLKYQKAAVTESTDELLTIKMRYKTPEGANSKLLTKTMMNDQYMDDDENLNWSAVVAAFGMILSDSEFKGNLSCSAIEKLANDAKGTDEYGYRAEFIRLVQIASRIQ